MTDNLRALRNNLIVRRIPEEPESDVIVMPDAFGEKSLRGEIVAVGPKATQVRCGEVIAFSQTASQNPFAHNNSAHWDSDDELIVLSEMDVLMVIDG